MTFSKIIEMADYMIKNNATIRQLEKEFGISKSTIHYNFVETLPDIDYRRYCAIRIILNKNKVLAHIRGGEATKSKHKK